jgi:hypothetical protein
VEDVFSVDENQSVTSGADDKSYVVQELFPSVKTPKPVGVPSTIYEEQSNCAHTANVTNHRQNNLCGTDTVATLTHSSNNKVQTDNSSTFHLDQGRLSTTVAADMSNHDANQPHQLQQETYSISSLKCNRPMDRNHLHNIIVDDDLVSSSAGYTVVETQQPAPNIDNSNLLLSLGETPTAIDNTPSTANVLVKGWQNHDCPLDNQIPPNTIEFPPPMSSYIEHTNSCSLYEEPGETVNIQQASSFEPGASQLIDITVDTPDLPFGLPMGSPTPILNREQSDELNIERAPSNPSAAATLFTATSTMYDDVSDSDSENL